MNGLFLTSSHNSTNGLFLTRSQLMSKKNSLFYNYRGKVNIPPVLPKLNINNGKIAGTESIKFLGILLDKNLSWKTHIKYIENKISKISVYCLKLKSPYYHFTTRIFAVTETMAASLGGASVEQT